MGRYLGVFTSDKSGPRWAEWRALSQAEQDARAADGLAPGKAWEAAHAGLIDNEGGPLGPTKRISDAGEVADTVNLLTVFMVVRADSHEAAVRLFEGHPHMSIFVCDGVEVMPVRRLTSESGKSTTVFGKTSSPEIAGSMASPPQSSRTRRVASSRPGSVRAGSTLRSRR